MWTPFALAQSTLGALLDAGAKRVSVAQFKDELVQRIISGPTATGGTLELIYATNGTIAGAGLARAQQVTPPAGVRGEWTTDEVGRICTIMRISGTAATLPVELPPRCQYWFKFDNKYFLSDSDTDRSAKVLSRTIKQ
ncbi:MAG TPA: hypothetical protein VMN56_03500 [Casimicrobiaceae bacterium]|nr:hypothetical protein [Casimicrobiaceae bacterium]